MLSELIRNGRSRRESCAVSHGVDRKSYANSVAWKHAADSPPLPPVTRKTLGRNGVRKDWQIIAAIAFCLISCSIGRCQDRSDSERITGSVSPNVVAGRPDSQEEGDSTGAGEETSVPPGVSEYLGRTIAETMSYHGAPWLVRNDREAEENCSLLLTQLNLKPGMAVCDLGCGNGYHTLPIARLIGERGRVFAVDIQPEMLTLLRAGAEREGLLNITPILGSVHDPRLPSNSMDLILLVDVYHEFSHPVEMLECMRTALKPQGLVALVEFRGEDEQVPIKPEHKMSKEQILKEFPANGFKLVSEFDGLPWQHLMFFAVDERPPKSDQ